MSPNIFLTGGTGYIGGSVLHTIAATYPEWPMTVLLRRTPPDFSTRYPAIKILTGDYNSSELLSSGAEKANIVIHCGDSDHVASLSALITGLLRRKTPGHLLHLSGSGIISDWASPPSSLGYLNPKTWSDISPTHLHEIRSLPATALHRATEKLLHDTIASHSDRIHIAILCPPDIYGRGSGPGKAQSAFLPFFVAEAKKLGSTFYTGDGGNARSWVHMSDLLRIYMHIVSAAASGSPEATNRYFGPNGYHFASTQEHSQRDVAVAVGEVLKKRGVLGSAEPKCVEVSVLDGMANIEGFPRLGRCLFASNARTRADRAAREWGFEGRAAWLMECLEGDVGDVLG